MDPFTIIAGLGWILIPLFFWGVWYAIKKGKERRGETSGLAAPADADPKGENEANIPDVHWLLGEDSPTGRKVLDCRPYALGMHMMTSDKAVAEKFLCLMQSDGDELDGKSPEKAWLVAVDWEFDYEQAAAMAEGMRAQSMEDLWMVDCRKERLYFRRSWTGQLMFMTNLRVVPTMGAVVTRIWVTGEGQIATQSPDYVAAYVRHLIDTHLLGVLTPFPIPPDFPGNEKEIASFVFHSVGRRGWLAEYFRREQI